MQKDTKEIMSKFAPVFFILLILVLSLSAVGCAALTPTPMPTATITATSIPTTTPNPTETSIPTTTLTPTPTATATPTSSPTPSPSPTVAYTAVPTGTVSQYKTSVQSRDQFKEWVIAGIVKCLGAQTGGQSAMLDFMNEAIAAGIIAKGQLAIGSGIPSTEQPTQCLYGISFNNGKSTIFYKDSETRKFVKLSLE
jgi:hypothetical protein